MNKENIEEIIAKSGASIPEDVIPEVVKVIELLTATHRSEVVEYEEVLKNLAGLFEYGADNIKKVDPKVMHRKIIWGINDLR